MHTNVNRTAQVTGLHHLAAIAGQVPAMPLPDAINLTVPTRAALAAVAAGLASTGTPFEWREGYRIRELIVPLNGLTYRIRCYDSALPSVQAAAEQEASA